MRTDGGQGRELTTAATPTIPRLGPIASGPLDNAPYARWLPRVVAHLLDAAALGAVAFVVLPVEPVVLPLWPGAAVPDGSSWTQSPWLVTAVLVGSLMQAYLGSTPGKLVVGIAVVDDRDGRPVGAIRTLVRSLLHLLDSILMIGYLRPLWHDRRQTFADSIVRTVVLETRSPLAHPWLGLRHPRGDEAPGPPMSWTAPAQPRWRARTTAVAAVLCVAGVVVALAPESVTAEGSGHVTCTPRNDATPGTAPRFLAGEIAVQREAVATKLGVSRPRTAGTTPGVEVVWDVAAPLTTGDVSRLRIVLSRADGSGERAIEHVLRDGVVEPGLGEPLMDGRTGVLLPLSVLDGLGDDWRWTLTVVTAGFESATCSGSTPGRPVPFS